MGIDSIGMPAMEYAPNADMANRMVVSESNLSLLVTNVIDTRNKILAYTTSNGGYMVNASTTNPQDAPTAHISVRIPANKLEDSLSYFHSLSIKVVSENLMGYDVTDQYVDIDKRIALLENTKARYEKILETATQVTDITNLTNQILQTQSQIDSYIGQKESLEKNAELAKLTIYLSTDEIALPYAPSETFRPSVIFKTAVRSLISSVRNVVAVLIWLGVYAVVWVPVGILYLYLRRRNR